MDGYQRLSTLFGCFIDPNSTNLNRNEREWKRSFDIVYNLQEDKFEFNRKTRSEIQIFQIPLYHFVTGEKFYDFQTELTLANIPEEEKREYIIKYKNFGSKISSYDIPSIDLVGGTIKEAVDIFSRLNSKGERITDDWKVSALSFSRERNFRFGSEIDKLFVRLKKYNFFTAKGDHKNKRELILQCVVTSFGKVYFDVSNVSKQLEALALQSNFIDACLGVMVSIEKAVKFLFEEVLVLDSKLLPYNNQLIFITEFFNKKPQPKRSELDKLKMWFWITTYSNYFTIYNLSKQRLAYEYFKNFIENESANPIYYDKYKQFGTIEFPKKIAMNSVRAKALALFMLNYSLHKEAILSSAPDNSNEIVGYSTRKLFRKLDNNLETNISENTVLLIDDSRVPFFIWGSDDVLSMMNEFGTNSERYFITEEIIQFYHMVGVKSEVLKDRLALIKLREREFVQSLNLVYQD